MNKPKKQAIPQQIRTNRLLLRPYQKRDAIEMFEYLQEPESYRYLEGPGTLLTQQQVEEIVSGHIAADTDNKYVWAMTLPNELVGAITIKFQKEHRIAEIGYHVSKSVWGQGYASEAGEAIVDRAFEAYPQLQRIQAGIHPENLGSIRVAERIGMEHEGTLRRYAYIRGIAVDEAIYAVLRDTWRSSKVRLC